MWSFITNPIVTHAVAVLLGLFSGWFVTLKTKVAAAEVIAKSDWDKFKTAALADIAKAKKDL